MRPWLGAARTLPSLNALAEARDVRTESGQRVRFVPPAQIDRYYEISVFETGCVATRADNLHDWFNALAWIAFPRTKARINAMHAAAIPLEAGQRGRLRDLLTLMDEGGALVVCADPELCGLLRGAQWKRLFWERKDEVRQAMRIQVFGHAVLEQALAPWPGITCKALVLGSEHDLDAQAARWLGGLDAAATPRLLPSVPVFGYPGWLPESASPAFYDDKRHFREPMAPGA